MSWFLSGCLQRVTTAQFTLALIAAMTIGIGGARAQVGAMASGYGPITSVSTPIPTWIGSWAAAPVGAVPGVSTGYPGYTFREVVHLSVGGAQVRVRLSNDFGTLPVLVAHTTVAVSAGNGSVAANTLNDVTWAGSTSVTIPAGTEAVSDPVPLAVPSGHDLLVSFYTPNTSGTVTYHSGGLQHSSYSTDGIDHTTDPTAARFPNRTTCWHYIDGVDVTGTEAPGGVVAFGDSITNGTHSTVDANERYPDFLADRLLALPPNQQLGVLNEAISGNRVLFDGSGQSALHRFSRDVLARPGVRTVVILEGINDIRSSRQLNATRITAGLQQLVNEAHKGGLRVIGGTLTPIEGSRSYSQAEEAKREAVNSWILQSGVCDGVVDFAAAVSDPSDPRRMLPQYDSGDHLHPNSAGYKAMAAAVDLSQL